MTLTHPRKGTVEIDSVFFGCEGRKCGDDVMKLTPKQEAFVDAYIETGNASEAARQAGYSPRTASRSGQENMQKPVIQQAIHDRQKEIRSKRTADITEVMEFLTSALRGELTDENIVTEGTGDGCSEARIIETRISSRDRLNAAQQLLKRFPRQMDVAEQEARIKRLASELESLEKANGVESVQIVDDLREDDTDDDDTAE
jgi:phage terminase small subunit